jgi:hypothetical protein
MTKFLIKLIRSLRWKTKIITELDEKDFFGYIDLTDCCKIGPIIDENYCPNCGRLIIKKINKNEN